MDDENYSGGEESDVEDDYSSEEEQNDAQSPKRKRGQHRIYAFKRSFDGMADALQFVPAENSWSKVNITQTLEGKNMYFRCNQTKWRSPTGCPSWIYLLIHADSEKVSLFQCLAEHDHSDATRPRGLPEAVRNEMDKIFDEGSRKPKQILKILEHYYIKK